MSDRVTLHHGSCLDVLRDLPDCSVDAVITDPPYGLANTTPEKITETVIRWANGERDYLPGTKGGFMGNPWDSFVPPAAVWDDCLRVLKPGGHVLAFAGSRTVDLMTLGLRMGGFEIRDSIAWLYGSGFPKSLDVSKAIDKERDDYPAIRHVVEFIRNAFASSEVNRKQLDDALGGTAVMSHFLALSRSNARCPTWTQWQTLKAVLRFGDAMDAEAWRLNGRKGKPGDNFEAREVIGQSAHKSGIGNATQGHYTVGGTVAKHVDITAPATPDAERWQGWGTALKPAHEPIVVARKPLEGTVVANVLTHGTGALNIDGCRTAERWPANVALDELQAARLAESRFFYVAKAAKSERPNIEGVAHPTVKPLALMRWLCRLVTPPGGTILEPFAGSGTTIEAALLEGFNIIGIEREAQYLPLIQARIERALATDPDLFGGAA